MEPPKDFIIYMLYSYNRPTSFPCQLMVYRIQNSSIKTFDLIKRQPPVLLFLEQEQQKEADKGRKRIAEG